eukprot:9834947-Alexandrium_andersonii.AAC.1
MSASLVGSEMCIRDRLTTIHPHLASLAAILFHQAFRRGSGHGLREHEVCLLYTSDAADDM